MDLPEILLALFIVVVVIVSLVSNLLVLLCFIYSTEIRKQVPGIFIMNLSFCNLLITVFNMPSTLLGIIKNHQPFGDWICQTVLKVARFHCKRIDIITMQTLLLLVDIHPSVKQRCLVEQKKRRQRATKKISIFIGSFIICFAPYIITRLIELLPFITVNHHWGIVSKCLTYSKAASDPFVYSLLRQQYKKVLVNIVNRILKRDLYPSSGHNSSLDTENDYCLQRVS
ncbi:G-protein coupled receptor 26 isoform X2 [Lepisosteus oculatus]|uniref:G-protein coupled receptor 26 isoform X2 n=1 Tax=Lepisosteus oculatus TaxID=7918 RepID=UPI00073FE9CD|nr:PREDICTED: G-protein coupled receptor 78 isoform X2 [Lepisosteus oculatus]